MKKYEGMFIIKPDLGEKDLEKAVDSIEKTVLKHDGKVINCKKWARRALAYPIKKYNDGEYYLCEFETEPKSISLMKNAYSLNEDILRDLIIVKE